MIKRLLIVVAIILAVVFVPYFLGAITPYPFLDWVWLDGLLLTIVFAVFLVVAILLYHGCVDLCKWIKNGDETT